MFELFLKISLSLSLSHRIVSLVSDFANFGFSKFEYREFRERIGYDRIDVFSSHSLSFSLLSLSCVCVWLSSFLILYMNMLYLAST